MRILYYIACIGNPDLDIKSIALPENILEAQCSGIMIDITDLSLLRHVNCEIANYY